MPAAVQLGDGLQVRLRNELRGGNNSDQVDAGDAGRRLARAGVVGQDVSLYESAGFEEAAAEGVAFR